MRILIVCGRDPVCNVNLRGNAEEAVRQLRLPYPVQEGDAEWARATALPDDVLVGMGDTMSAIKDVPGRRIVVKDGSRPDEIIADLESLMAPRGQA